MILSKCALFCSMPLVLQAAAEGSVVVKGGANRLRSRPKWVLAFTLHYNPRTAAHRCPGEESVEALDKASHQGQINNSTERDI